MNIEEILKPKNKFEKMVLTDEDIRQGLLWGKKRPGHPEGKVIFHVKEVLEKIEKKEFDKLTEMKLRFIAFLHDSLKNKCDKSKPKVGKNNHGYIAREYAKIYSAVFGRAENDVLQIIRWHDEPYYITQELDISEANAKRRIHELLNQNIIDWRLFLDFVLIDGTTGDKEGIVCIGFYEILLAQEMI